MSEPFIGEIRYLPYSFAPEGWFPCDGRQYSIQQYAALFSILGTTFGGDGKTTFGVPNLMPPTSADVGPAVAGLGTAPGSSTPINYGKTIGSSGVTLNTSNVPPHTHQLSRKSPTNVNDLTTRTTTPNINADVGALGIINGSTATYLNMLSPTPATTPDTTLHPSTLSPSGGGTNGAVFPHENRQPCLTFLPAIAWNGVYPVSD